MKAKCFLLNGLSVAATLSLLMISCVNKIADESIIEVGNTPIQLSTNIYCVQSRVMENKFQNNDAIGLYVLTQPNKIKDERYIDNAILIHSSSDSFEAEDTLYYPKQKVLCDFISYFPYQKDGFAINQSNIEVKINKDLSKADNYSQSDFMVANTQNIEASNHPIKLTFQHKMAKLYIKIKPKNDNKKITDVLFSFPKITLNNFYTQATYNLENNDFSNFQASSNIYPFGEWSVDNNFLIGKVVNLFPQKIGEQQSITIDVDNESYSCLLPADLSLKMGEISELTINFTPSKGIEVESFHPLIADWKKGENTEIENQQMYKEISLSELNFQSSNIYQLLSKERTPIYEITKELLLSDTMKGQAIVAYPIKNGSTLLTKGIVLDIIGNNQPIHGGTISWNALNNTFEYTEGTHSPIHSFYIDNNNQLVFDTPENIQSVYLCNKVLVDKRGKEINNYPLVKIGTQYWMRSELKTVFYNDNSKMEISIDKIDPTIPSVIKTKKHPDLYFYNDKLVLTNKVAPEGWKLPNQHDWDILINYIQGDVSLLKNTEWTESEESYLTGFDANKTSAFIEGVYRENSSSTCYWLINDNNPSELLDNSAGLLGSRPEYSPIPNMDTKALSIRCLLKQ